MDQQTKEKLRWLFDVVENHKAAPIAEINKARALIDLPPLPDGSKKPRTRIKVHS